MTTSSGSSEAKAPSVPIQLTTTNGHWSTPTGLAWRSVSNGKHNGIPFWPAGSSPGKTALYVARTLVSNIKSHKITSSWQAVGEYHPVDKHGRVFRLPNYSVNPASPSLNDEEKQAQVLCTTDPDGENSYELNWAEIEIGGPFELTNEEEEKLNLFVAGRTATGKAMYVVRAYCKKGHGVTGQSEHAAHPVDYGYAIGTLIEGGSRALIPYGNGCQVATKVGFLQVRRSTGASSVNKVSKDLRWQMVNAAYVSKANGSYGKYCGIAQVTDVQFFATCPTPQSALGAATPNAVFDFETMVPFPEVSPPLYTPQPDVQDTQNYLNVAYVGVLDRILTEDRGVVVGCRGTSTIHPQDILIDLIAGQLEYAFDGEKKGMVHAGFYLAVQPLFTRIENEVLVRLAALESSVVYLTGHSKGGGMANIIAIYLAEHHPTWDIRVITFGTPKMGDDDLVSYHSKLIKSSYSFVFEADIIPLLPLTATGVSVAQKTGSVISSVGDMLENLFNIPGISSGGSKIGSSFIAAIIANIFNDKSGHHISSSSYKWLITLDDVNLWLSSMETLNAKLSSNKGISEYQQVQLGLQNVSSTMDDLPSFLKNWLGDAATPLSSSSITLLGFASLLQVWPDLLTTILNGKLKPPSGGIMDIFYNKLMPEINTFCSNISGYIVADASKVISPYAYTQQVQYLVQNGNGGLSVSDGINFSLFKDNLLQNMNQKVLNTKDFLEFLQHFLGAFILDHSKYTSVLNPY